MTKSAKTTRKLSFLQSSVSSSFSSSFPINHQAMPPSPLRHFPPFTRTPATAITRRLSDIRKYHYPETVTDKSSAKAFRTKQKRIEKKRIKADKENPSLGYATRPGAGILSYDSPLRYTRERYARFQEAFKSEELFKLEQRAMFSLPGDGPVDSLLELFRARYIERHTNSVSNKDNVLTDDIPFIYEKLIEEIKLCDDVYYSNDGNTENRVRDEVYDEMIMHLIELERVYPQITREDSPSLNVGHVACSRASKLGMDVETQDDIENLPKSHVDGHSFGEMDSMLSFNKTVPVDQVSPKVQKNYKHITPMLSLDNAYSHEQIESFVKRANIHGEDEIFTELKIDGVALSLEYHNGSLNKGITRGSGRVGDDVTDNIKQSLIGRGIVEHIENSNSNEIILIRGEVYIENEEFLKLNERLDRKLSNSRNAASGALRHKDPKEARKRNIKFMAYECISSLTMKNKFSTQLETIEELSKWGFSTMSINEHTSICKNVNEIEEYAKKIELIRSKLRMSIDGIVLKFNHSDIKNEVGFTARSPKGAIAYKFNSQARTTQLNDVVFQVSRKGVITPVAILQPVKLSGVTLSRATLHNFEYIKNKLTNLSVHDDIRVERGGDVIPKVVSIVKHNGGKSINIPEVCPVCGSKVEQVLQQAKGGITLYVCNAKETCNAQIHGRIIHFVSKYAMDIKGVGKKTIQKLINENLVVIPADLFRLTVDDIKSLDGYADESSNNIINALDDARNNRSLQRLIIGLGLPGIGRIASREFAKKLQSLNNLVNFVDSTSSHSDLLLSVPGIAERTAHSLSKFLRNHQNIAEIKAIANLVKPCRVLDEEDEDFGDVGGGESVQLGEGSRMMKDKSFVFTGKLIKMNRAQVMKFIRKIGGGKVTADVSKKTDYVVHGTSPGQKFFKAQRLNVMTIDENDFLELFNISTDLQTDHKLLN